MACKARLIHGIQRTIKSINYFMYHLLSAIDSKYSSVQDVLKSTRSQLEREMALEDVSTVKDLPAYNFLRR